MEEELHVVVRSLMEVLLNNSKSDRGPGAKCWGSYNQRATLMQA